MDNSPDYPPPPSQPPEPPPPPSEPPPYSPPTAAQQWPATPPYYQGFGQPPMGQPQPRPQSSRRLWTIMAVVAGVALLVMIAAAYGFIGFSSANGKVSAANRAIDATVSHRNALDSAPSTFDLSATDAKSFQTNAARWMQTWKGQATTIANDDQSLATAGLRLHDQQWLTLIRQDSLNSASNRVDHARKAMKAAATIATERQAEGKFLVAYATVITDTETLVNDEQNGDSVAALAAASRLPNDVAQTITLVNDPQFPTELKQYLTSIQTVAQDLVDYLNAEAAGDTAKAKAIQTKANADIAAGNQIDVSQVPTKIDTYYQPLIDTYHNELARAQA